MRSIRSRHCYLSVDGIGIPAGEAVLQPGVPELVGTTVLAQDLQIARLYEK